MKKTLIALLLLSACSGQPVPQAGGNDSAPAAEQPKEAAARPKAARIGSLAGLYEGGSGDRKHQMCVVEGKGEEQRFGLVVWGANDHSCSGSGAISREGDRVRLAMAGDSACTIEAAVSGKTIELPEEAPEGCAYYCGARASLGGADLTQVGTTREDAMKARDLVGDPLCGGEE